MRVAGADAGDTRMDDTGLRKMMIVNLLGRRFGLSSYLELATPSTGRFYHQVDRDHFRHVARMMYVTPFLYDDGLPVDFRSPDEDLTGVMEDLRALGRGIDIAFVDGWHTYQAAFRDLSLMVDLVPDGGVLVVHDCLPENRDGASPRFRQGEWWGLTYKAFLDLVLRRPGLDYVTLDCDHGCGVIVKNRSLDRVLGTDGQGTDELGSEGQESWLPDRPDPDLVARWLTLGPDADLSFALFMAERDRLMRVVPPDRFLALFSAEDIRLSRKDYSRPGMAGPTCRPAGLDGPVAPERPGLARRVQRFLKRKLAEMTAP